MTPPGPRRAASKQRVKIIRPSPLLTLQSARGHIVGPSQWEGYVIVKLNKPAIYHRWDGTTGLLSEIIEHPKNMRVLP